LFSIKLLIYAAGVYPDNPITGRGLPINSIGIAIEVFQVAFIVLCGLIITRDRTRKEVDKKQL